VFVLRFIEGRHANAGSVEFLIVDFTVSDDIARSHHSRSDRVYQPGREPGLFHQDSIALADRDGSMTVKPSERDIFNGRVRTVAHNNTLGQVLESAVANPTVAGMTDPNPFPEVILLLGGSFDGPVCSHIGFVMPVSPFPPALEPKIFDPHILQTVKGEDTGAVSKG